MKLLSATVYSLCVLLMMHSTAVAMDTTRLDSDDVSGGHDSDTTSLAHYSWSSYHEDLAYALEYPTNGPAMVPLDAFMPISVYKKKRSVAVTIHFEQTPLVQNILQICATTAVSKHAQDKIYNVVVGELVRKFRKLIAVLAVKNWTFDTDNCTATFYLRKKIDNETIKTACNEKLSYIRKIKCISGTKQQRILQRLLDKHEELA